MVLVNRKLVLIGIGVLASLVLVGAILYDNFLEVSFGVWPKTNWFYSETVGGQTTHYRLDYESKEEWRKEIIDGTPDGSGADPRIGSYVEAKDGHLNWYETESGNITSRPLGSYQYPHRDFRPGAIIMMDGAFGPARYVPSTPVKLCFEGKCVGNAPGWAFEAPEGTYVFADDQRGLPLVVPGLTITEVLVHAQQEEYRGYQKDSQPRP